MVKHYTLDEWKEIIANVLEHGKISVTALWLCKELCYWYDADEGEVQLTMQRLMDKKFILVDRLFNLRWNNATRI